MKIRLLIYLLLFGSFLSVSAQEIEVKGVITSAEDGFPLPGVSVIISGTTKGSCFRF